MSVPPLADADLSIMCRCLYGDKSLAGTLCSEFVCIATCKGVSVDHVCGAAIAVCDTICLYADAEMYFQQQIQDSS